MSYSSGTEGEFSSRGVRFNRSPESRVKLKHFVIVVTSSASVRQHK